MHCRESRLHKSPRRARTSRSGKLEGTMIARHALTLMIAAGLFSGAACHGATAKEVGKTGANRAYQVYLLKGLAVIFSTGLDFLQAKLQARALVGEVDSHAQAEELAQSGSTWHGQITRGAGFHGALENVDLAQTPGITHWNIEKAEPLHAATIAKVLMLIPTHKRAAATAPPAAAPATYR